MKRLIVWMWSLLGAVAALAQPGYKIDIEVKGFGGNQALLAYYYGDKQYVKDTVPVSNGSFSFSGDEALDGGMYLVVLPPKNNYFELVIDKDQHFSLATDTADFVRNMKIKGSKDNELFYQDLIYIATKRKEAQDLQARIQTAGKGSAEAKPLEEALDRLNEEVMASRAAFIKNNPDALYAKLLLAVEEPEIPEQPLRADGSPVDSLFAFKYYRGHYFDNVDFGDARLIRTPVLNQKATQYVDKLTYRHPDSINVALDYIIGKARANDDVFQFFVIHFLNKYAQSKVMGYDAIYVHLVEKYYMSGDAWWVDSATIAKMTERAISISPTLIGRRASDFFVQDVDGRQQHPYGIGADYLILYFWDYDCGHCKKITPQLAKSFARYQGRSVKLFTVSINGDVETWKKKLGEYGLVQEQVINCQDHRRLSGFDGMYDIRSTPRIFLIDKDKKIMAKQISVDQLDEILSRELGMEPPAELHGPVVEEDEH
ncbi:MAG: hypothetical protein OHK0039_35510 [Bacteroidia bacterium]